MAGFHLNLLLQAAIQRLQPRGHSIETTGYLSEFVFGIHLDPGGKLAHFDLAQTPLQPRQRVDDILIAGVEHDHRCSNGQCHHHELKQVENCSQPGQLLLNGQHQLVDGRNKLRRGRDDALLGCG